MARPLRIEYDGAIYHVTSRGNEKRLIYKDEEDRRIFLDTRHKTNVITGYVIRKADMRVRSSNLT